MNEDRLAAVGLDILMAARAELGMSMPYLAEALYALAPAPGDEVTISAATDGVTLYYNGSYLADCYLRSGKLVNRLVLHGILHCMFRHLRKRRGRDAVLWDLACDAAVESVIDSLPYPCLQNPGAPSRAKFYGECRRELKVLTAEGIYRLLLRNPRPEYEIAQLQRAFLMDDHSLWDMEEKRQKEQTERQDQLWQSIASKTQTSMQTIPSPSGQQGEAMSELLAVAARDDVDYRRFLRRFAAPREVLRPDDDAFDYIYYSYGLQTYGNMPLIEPPETKEEERIEDFVIAIDTSMSTSGALVRAFLASTYAILRSTDTFTRRLNIHILQCDDRLRSDTLIRSAEELHRYMAELKLTGGSATDFRPVFEHISSWWMPAASPICGACCISPTAWGSTPRAVRRTRRPSSCSPSPMTLEIPAGPSGWCLELPELESPGSWTRTSGWRTSWQICPNFNCTRTRI